MRQGCGRDTQRLLHIASDDYRPISGPRNDTLLKAVVVPQELALYIGFTIGETFRYFGWLSGIPKDELALRTASLIKFLDLPPAHCVIGQLRWGPGARGARAKH